MYEYIASYLGDNKDNTKNNILNHLDLVLSNKKKLKEKNLNKYFKVLGGNYKINSDKTINNSYKLFKLGIKNNIKVDTLVNKFKGSAPKLYDKLESKITEKYMNYSDSNSSFSGGEDEDEDTSDSDDSLATNLSGMSDIPSVKGYSEDKLPEYAKLKLKIYHTNDEIKKAMVALIKKDDQPGINVANTWILRDSSPNTWDLQYVLKNLASTYKISNGNMYMYDPNNFDISKHTYKDKYDEKIEPIVNNYDAKVNFKTEEYKSLNPDKELSKLFGRDGLLVSMYDKLLRPSEHSKNLTQFLLYWFYYVEPTSESILEKTSWTKIDKEHGNKIIYNPTAGLLMRIIEVLHYINIRYLYPQCVIKIGNCDKLKASNSCGLDMAKITNMNRKFLSKLNKIDLSIKEKIQKKMSKGKYSVVFREFYDFINFNEKGTPKYKDKLTYKVDTCEDILKRGLDSINYTYTLMGGIKNTRYNRDYTRDYDRDYDRNYNRREPMRDNYNRGGYDDYNRYDDIDGGYRYYNNRYDRGGGYNRYYDDYNRYYPDNMHGGALGEFRQEINRNIFNTLREQILNLEL